MAQIDVDEIRVPELPNTYTHLDLCCTQASPISFIFHSFCVSIVIISLSFPHCSPMSDRFFSLRQISAYGDMISLLLYCRL